MNTKFNAEYLASIKELREHLVEVCRTENHTSGKPIPILEGKVISNKEEIEKILNEIKSKGINGPVITSAQKRSDQTIFVEHDDLFKDIINKY